MAGAAGHRELVMKLRALRKGSGVGTRELARRIGVSHATVSRTESGVRCPSPAEVGDWAEALALEPVLAESLRKQARAAHEPGAMRVNRSHVGSSLRDPQHTVALMEREAQKLVAVQYECLPGLLQSPAYCEYMHANAPLIGRKPRAQFVKERLLRQGRLRPNTSLVQLMSADILFRRPRMSVGDWIDQLHLIRSALRRPGQEVGVLPARQNDRQLRLSGLLLDDYWAMSETHLATVAFTDRDRIDLLRRNFELELQQAELGAGAEKLIDEAIDYCSRFK